ncbi:hypothetical protein [Archangium sp.]|uniref:hypothetical protein n=1 Tax=Archangium sp. TaxID=1872627 RepID=UPI00286B83C0|nr:hypothetical protein [Archangium sp.]
MRHRIGALVLFASMAGLLGCGPSPLEACARESEPVLSGESVYRCTMSEDCPRPSQLPLCVTNTRPERECVRCEATRCVRAFPLPESC